MATKQAAPKPVPAPVIGGGSGGVTHGVGPGQSSGAVRIVHRNPEADGRLYGSTPFAGKPARGFIQEYMPPGNGEVYFMYNPNEFLYTYQFNTDLANPASTAQIPTMGALGGTGISFDLQFNRQYEVAFEGDPVGVMQDIDALKYVVGMKDPTISYMLMKILKFTLGKNLVFYGVVQNLSVRLGLFSEQMVPMYAQVQLGAIQMPANFDPSTLYGASYGAVTSGQATTAASNAAKTPTVGGAKPSAGPARPTMVL